MTYLEWTTAIGPQTKYSDPSPTGKYMPARGDKQKTFLQVKTKTAGSVAACESFTGETKLDSGG